MYTNNLIKAFQKPLFDSSFPFFFKFKITSYFCQMIKKTITRINCQWKTIFQPKKIIIINIVIP